MRLLVITASYPPHQIGGYEIRCKDVVEELIRRDHEVLVLTSQCPTKTCKIHNSESSIERFLHEKKNTKNVLHQIYTDIKDLRHVDKKTKEFKPDLIYLWGIQSLSNAILPYFSYQKIQIVYDEGSSGLVYLSRIYKRGLYFFHNGDDPLIKGLLKKGVYLIANRASLNLIRSQWTWPKDMKVYFNCNSSLEYAQDGGVPLTDAQVIYSGINIVKFPFRMRERINLPVTIMVPGRIKPAKGTKDAIYLVKELVKRGVNVELVIVGRVQSEEYFAEVMRLIDLNALHEKVKYLPMLPQNELAVFYQSADICFVPSYFKTGLSRVPLEGMASGCVVLTYGNEGSREIIQNGKTGFIVPEGNVFFAADVIERMIQNPDKYKKIIQDARLRIEKEHSFDRYIDLIEAYLHLPISKNADTAR